jgi:hypothetical protein
VCGCSHSRFSTELSNIFLAFGSHTATRGHLGTDEAQAAILPGPKKPLRTMRTFHAHFGECAESAPVAIPSQPNVALRARVPHEQTPTQSPPHHTKEQSETHRTFPPTSSLPYLESGQRATHRRTEPAFTISARTLLRGAAVSKQRRWQEPSTVIARVEYRELRKELKRAGSKKRRDELIAKLDALYARSTDVALAKEPSPPKNGTPVVSGSSAELAVPDSKSPVCGQTQAYWRSLMDKIETGKADSFQAKNAPPAEGAFALLEEFPEHPLRKLAAEVSMWVWQQDMSRPRPDLEQMVGWKIISWLKREPHNRHDAHGNAETVSNAVDDVYKLLSEREAADPDWFACRAERLFHGENVAMTQEHTKPSASESELNPMPGSVPVPVPPVPGTTDLPKQVDLILQIDAQHLGRLAAHSPDFNSGIRACLSRQLQEHGFADGIFLCNLYNAMRPKGLGAFPPRSF